MIADIFEFTGLWALLIATMVGVMKNYSISMLSTTVFDLLDLALLSGAFWQFG
jgi:hypothetical protein